METRFALKEKDWMGAGKKSFEWDLNDWKWDGDLFVATPLNSIPFHSREFIPMTGGSSNSSSCSDEINTRSEKGKNELEKRRRVVVIEDDDELNDVAENLTLNLGEHVYPISEGDGGIGKKMKLLQNTSTATTTSRAVCQVEDCGVDLSVAKPYHRRHKVCEVHSKASQSIVGNVMQRFCQQCSR